MPRIRTAVAATQNCRFIAGHRLCGVPRATQYVAAVRPRRNRNRSRPANHRTKPTGVSTAKYRPPIIAAQHVSKSRRKAPSPPRPDRLDDFISVVSMVLNYHGIRTAETLVSRTADRSRRIADRSPAGDCGKVSGCKRRQLFNNRA